MLFNSLLALSLLSPLLAGATPGVVEAGLTKFKRTTDSGLFRRRDDASGPIDATLVQSALKNEYLINITVGTPPQSLAVTLDTGSSDLWIPASSSQICSKDECDDGSFDETKSSTYKVVQQGGFNITYQQANDVDAGDFATDVVTLPGNGTINNLQFGLALTETVDKHGVMGVSYNQTEATVSQQGNAPYPDILDQLLGAGLIARRAFSLWLNDVNSPSGSIIFGGIDTTKYDGDLIGLPTQASEDGTIREYNVALTSVSFTDNSGTHTLSSSSLSVAALLDSGTSQTYLPDDIFIALVNGLGAIGASQGVSIVPCDFAFIPNATINYGFGGQGGPVISVPLSQVVGETAFPPAQFSDPSGGCILGIAPPNGGVILGDTFLRSAYLAYDQDNNQIAMAPAKLNVTSSSIVPIPAGSGFPGVSSYATASATVLPTETSTPAAPSASASGSTVLAGTPTFNLAKPTVTAAQGSGGSSSSSSGAAALPMVTGAVGAAALFGGAAMIMNM